MSDSGSALELLPNELLCYVLSMLNGRSLAHAEGACQRWHSIVTMLGQGFNIWFRCCLKEYGLDMVVAQTGLTALLSHRGRAAVEGCKEQWLFWKEVYAKFQRSHRVCSGMWGMKMETVQKRKGVVTAMTLHRPTMESDITLWSGYRKGFLTYTHLPAVTSWKEEKLNNSLHVSWRHCDACTAITSVTLGDDGLDQSQSETYMISIDIDGRIMVTNDKRESLVLPRVAFQAFDVSSLGPYFLVAHEGSFSRGCMINKVVRKLGPFPRSELPIAIVPIIQLCGHLGANLHAVALGYNQATMGDDCGNIYHWYFPPLTNFDDVEGSNGMVNTLFGRPIPLQTIYEPTHLISLQSGVRQILLHQEQILVHTQAADSTIYIINTDNWQKMHVISQKKMMALTPYSCAMIQRLAVWGSVLAVGCRSGGVMLFRITSKDWPSDISSNLISVFHAKMDDLQTLCFSDDGQGTILAVAGDKTNIFRWRRGEKNLVKNMNTREPVPDLSTVSIT